MQAFVFRCLFTRTNKNPEHRLLFPGFHCNAHAIENESGFHLPLAGALTCNVHPALRGTWGDARWNPPDRVCWRLMGARRARHPAARRLRQRPALDAFRRPIDSPYIRHCGSCFWNVIFLYFCRLVPIDVFLFRVSNVQGSYCHFCHCGVAGSSIRRHLRNSDGLPWHCVAAPPVDFFQKCPPQAEVNGVRDSRQDTIFMLLLNH